MNFTKFNHAFEFNRFSPSSIFFSFLSSFFRFLRSYQSCQAMEIMKNPLKNEAIAKMIKSLPSNMGNIIMPKAAE